MASATKAQVKVSAPLEIGDPVRQPSAKGLSRIALYALLAVLGFLYAAPFIWMFLSSFKIDAQIDTIPPTWIPNPFRWQNYIEALQFMPWGRYAVNTLFRYTTPVVLGVLVSNSFIAYGFARIRWTLREPLFFLCIATMMIPGAVTMIPLFIVFKKLGWIDTYLPLVIPAYFGSAYNIFLLRQFLLTLPQELSDAARIDGCSELGTMVRIILPLAKPALTVVALFTFMGCWSDYMGPLIYINENARMPIALALQSIGASMRMSTTYVKNTMPYSMAISTLVVLPVLLIFFFAQRAFIEGIAITGLKQ